MRLTRRGKVVRAIALLLVAIGILYGIGKVSANLWWTDSGYCWGSYEKCYPMEGEGK
jgi:hypothetical protein